MVKNLPAVQETWVRSLGQEDPLEKEMAAQGEFHGWRSLAGYSLWGLRVRQSTERLTLHFKVVSERLNALLGFCSSIGH